MNQGRDGALEPLLLHRLAMARMPERVDKPLNTNGFLNLRLNGGLFLGSAHTFRAWPPHAPLFDYGFEPFPRVYRMPDNVEIL
jgi:hypothetical protein